MTDTPFKSLIDRYLHNKRKNTSLTSFYFSQLKAYLKNSENILNMQDTDSLLNFLDEVQEEQEIVDDISESISKLHCSIGKDGTLKINKYNFPNLSCLTKKRNVKR